MVRFVDMEPTLATSSHMPFDRAQMKQKTAALAAKGVYIGTSSWKYEGWVWPALYAVALRVSRRGRQDTV